MPRIHQIYRQLQATDDPSVDRAMAAALPTADRFTLRLMALILLQRQHPDGTLGLVLHYHQLPEDLQRTVVDRVDSLYKPLRVAAGRRHTAGPANTLCIIRRSRRVRLTYLVLQLLNLSDPALQDQAGECLLHLAEHAATDPLGEVLPTLSPRDARDLQQTLSEAVRDYARHRREAVLLAAAWLLPRPAAALWQDLNDPKTPATRAMAGLAQRADHPAVRRSLPLLLAQPALADAALIGLRQCAARQNMGELLTQPHLLRFKPIADALARAHQPASLCPDIDRLLALPPEQGRGLPAWIMALPLDRRQKVQHLRTLQAAPDMHTRLLALRKLLDLADHAHDEEDAPAPPLLTPPQARPAPLSQLISEAVALFCDDPEPALARIALRHLARLHDPALPHRLARLINSPHPELRRFASEQFAPIGFSRLWDAWPSLSPSHRLAAGRALIKIDAHFHRHLAEKLAVPDRKARLRALAMIHDLNQGSFFESSLTRLSEDADEVIASAAVKALGSAGTESARVSLEQALEHADTRIRANAVEALSQVRSTQHVRKLIEMAADEENRPRANAIQQLMQMRTREALPSLVQMLSDERAAHRASALWVVETMGLLEVARQVAEMSVSDDDEKIRLRADRVIRELIAIMGAPQTQAG